MKKITLVTAIVCSLLFSFSSAWALAVATPDEGCSPGSNHHFSSQWSNWDFLALSGGGKCSLPHSGHDFISSGINDLKNIWPSISSNFYNRIISGHKTGFPFHNHCRVVIAPPGDNSSTVDTPEPATMLLLGSGLVGLAGFGRKKLKAQQ